MDNYRLILLLSLGVVLFLIYQAWIEDYGPGSRLAVDGPPAQELAGALPEGVPEVAVEKVDATNDIVNGGVGVIDQPGQLAPISVETDVLRLEISPRGGTVTSAWLKNYSALPDKPDVPFRLLKPEPPSMFVAQSGFLSTVQDRVPTHEAIFHSSQSSYGLGDGDELVVDLEWEGPAGTRVIKRYHFERGSYDIRVSHEVVNGSSEPIALRSYSQLQRTDYVAQEASRFVKTYTGGVYYSPEDKYKKVQFSEMKDRKLDRQAVDGWIAMIQHYFMSAWIPPRGEQRTFYTNAVGDSRYIIGMYSPVSTIAPGGTLRLEEHLFVGPKLQDTLASIATGLDLAVDYGWLTILAQPIFWLLSKIHGIIGNWGWSIVILTIIIKLLFFKLSETSYRSMAGMRNLAPRLQALKDRYGDDKERLNQAMMELYKKEKINPLGGCLPILIQIPVFIALYWVLLESVELRYAPFMFWLNNLSAPDPYFVLPLIMGVSMFIQTKLNPPPPDPIQAKIVISLPFVFTAFFAFFPSGLVLYWTTNNILSIAQQWYITKQMEKQDKKK